MVTQLITHPMVLPVTFPLLAGLICLLIPNKAESLRSVLAVVSTAVVMVLVWPLFQQAGTTLELTPWLSLRIDTLSAFILLAVAFFGLFIAIYSVGYMQGRERHREYFTYLLWTLGISCGVMLANDLLFLLVCWGFLGLLLYLMIGIAGPGAADAARKSLMIIGGSDALLLFGIVLYWQLAGTTRMDGPALALDSPVAYVSFLAFMAGAFAKAGAVPFHTWVPDFGEKADAPVSAYLPASLDKLLGIYLLVRCVHDLFVPTPAMYMMLMVVGAVTVLTAVMMALVQHDLKRLLSYHAVSQVGYMVLGIGTGTAIGLAGGLFHMLNHAIYKCALFLCAGVVEKETGATDLDRLGGLAKMLPVTFIVFTVAALSRSGIPPLNGFASKWMIYQGIIVSGEASGGLGWIVWLAVAMLGSALTLASLLAALCVIFGVFAFQVPLGLLIFPVVQVDVPGVWWAGLATMLIVGAIVVGLLVYWLTMRHGKLRRVTTYIGGELLQDVYVSGEEAGPKRHIEVTGVDFYNTIEQLPVLQRLYTLARAKAFDLYDLVQQGVNYVIQMLRSLHTGILPTYLRWFVVGLVVVVWVVTQSGS
jgi:formate hydrogenlyase subunit 3/multisubunit Na+/H+ antiporter MnhD subunit